MIENIFYFLILNLFLVIMLGVILRRRVSLITQLIIIQVILVQLSTLLHFSEIFVFSIFLFMLFLILLVNSMGSKVKIKNEGEC